jgi:hypothetical protein
MGSFYAAKIALFLMFSQNYSRCKSARGIDIKKACRFNCRFCFWVTNGARTHDPQNHNLML